MGKLRQRIGFLLGLLIFMTAHSHTAGADASLRLFTDASYIYEDNTASNFFQIHDLDFFLTGNVDKQVTYLAEVNFQPGFTGVGAEIERTIIQYTISPWFKVSAGRYHTALGYWNDTYHHGSYLQTAASRPVMERFEDAGGMLPTHNTGIEVRGNGPVSTGNFGYIFNIGNGRGPVQDPPAFFYSYNKSKSISGVVYYEFDNGLRVGGSFWRSDLPGGSQLDDDSTQKTTTCTPGALGSSPGDPVSVALANCGPKGTETIFGAHAIYNSPTIEWLTEYHSMYHSYTGGWTNADGSTQTLIHLLYSQLGYHLGGFTPYLRYELNATSTADAYLNSNPGYIAQGLPATTRYYSLGSRYELSANSALKLELTYINSGAPVFQANLPNPLPAGSGKSTDWTVNLNWSMVL